MLKNNKNYYVKKVAGETGRKYKDVLKEMELDRIKFGITFRDYYIGKIHKVPPHEKKKAAISLVRNKEKKKERIISIKEQTGMSAKTILRNIDNLKKKGIINVTLAQYEKYSMFDKNETQNMELLQQLKRRDLLVKELRAKLPMLDSGEISYGEFEEELAKVYVLTEKVLPDSHIQKVGERVMNILPENMMNEDTMRHIVYDMEVTRLVLRFGYTEYIMFRFFERNLKEKRTFLSSTERREVLKKINDSRTSVILNNKFLCYQQMKSYYGREAVLIRNEKSFKQFKTFVKKYPVFVVKPTELSFGKGIMKVEAETDNGLKEQFDTLLKAYGEFMLEELIIQHEAMRCLNPDSVNTIRVTTYNNNGKTIVHRPFIKIGRKGSFVDNGGSGGILAAIDYENGEIISNGMDENGVVYERHPDNDIRFKGYRLPDWDKINKLVSSVSNEINNSTYVGWDFACTDEGDWIVVEGNAMTQFIGQQAPQGKGMREEFLKDIE